MEWLLNRRRMMYNKKIPPEFLTFEDDRVWEICCYSWGDTELIQGKIAEGTIICDGSALVYSDSVFANCTAITSHKSSTNSTISASAAAQNFSIIISVDNSNVFSDLGDDDVAIRIVQHVGNPSSVTELTTVTKAQWVAGQSNNQMTISATSTNACKYLMIGVYGANGVTAVWTINAITGNRQPVGITKKQCAVVTSFGTAFQGNRLLTIFDVESTYFTGVTAGINSQAFGNTRSMTYLRIPYATTIGGGDAANYAVVIDNTVGPNLRLDAVTKVRALYNAGSLSSRYVVCTTSEVPIATCRYIYATWYVLDELVNDYKAADYFKSTSYAVIKSLHDLPTDYPDCPWIADLRAKGLIPSN